MDETIINEFVDETQQQQQQQQASSSNTNGGIILEQDRFLPIG